ncbi:hypothetical protein BDZ97DRAFT_1761304 [Flammula alnicola]|nr:hypothetical protein BDZ97DRAFT_1761304 [Flammula alnicola]
MLGLASDPETEHLLRKLKLDHWQVQIGHTTIVGRRQGKRATVMSTELLAPFMDFMADLGFGPPELFKLSRMMEQHVEYSGRVTTTRRMAQRISDQLDGPISSNNFEHVIDDLELNFCWALLRRPELSAFFCDVKLLEAFATFPMTGDKLACLLCALVKVGSGKPTVNFSRRTHSNRNSGWIREAFPSLDENDSTHVQDGRDMALEQNEEDSAST